MFGHENNNYAKPKAAWLETEYSAFTIASNCFLGENETKTVIKIYM